MSRDIEASTLVKAPIDDVFTAIASSEGWDKWFTNGTTIEPRVDGIVHLVWTDVGPDREHMEDRGRVLAYAPPFRFEFTWGQPESVVTVTLSSRDDGTLVELTERGIPAEEAERFVSCAVGWGEALTLMKFWVEHGVTYW
ncbi:SRPBCC family protein [Agromyces intestinalis]|uniref:SRPBCC family protein n=1 Tax=Agromyces intestinalis TaxID=2592652 RepID=UPI00143D2ADF|nr:SRPBCC domain-containing protein [Agromyces intestinalis]